MSFLCVISLYDCTCQWDYILCHLFLLVCKCWYCITCDLLRFLSVKLCEQRAFWEIYVLLLNTSIFGELGQHKPIALGSISVFQWDSHYFALGGHWVSGFSSLNAICSCQHGCGSSDSCWSLKLLFLRIRFQSKLYGQNKASCNVS